MKNIWVLQWKSLNLHLQTKDRVSSFAGIQKIMYWDHPVCFYSWRIPAKGVVFQVLSHIQLFATPYTAPCQASLFLTISQSLLKLMSIESVMPSNHLVLCHPLLLPSTFPSIRVVSNESALRIRWPKYWSCIISPSSEYSGLISFRIDWLDLCSPRDSQESSPTPQFKTINSSLFSLLYSPTVTSIHDHWKNHSIDYMDLCRQSNLSAF